VCFRGALILALSLAAPPLAAELPVSDGVLADRLLSDAELYRLTTCGAPPGGACLGPVVRWAKPSVTLRVDPGPDPLPPGLEARITRAAARAIAEINGTGAGITVSLTIAGSADITIRTTSLPEGTEMPDQPGFSGPGIMGVGYMTVWWDDSHTILEAVVLISTTIETDILDSVVLEEVTQSLGFLFDIDGPAYADRSIFAQDTNSVMALAGQDAALLRLHYPPP
jgi:hypothetical protein